MERGRSGPGGARLRARRGAVGSVREWWRSCLRRVKAACEFLGVKMYVCVCVRARARVSTPFRPPSLVSNFHFSV